jgi:hypothetical protein
LQLDDRPPDAKPDQLPVAVAAFEHLISASGCHYLSVRTVLADQQIGRTPDAAIGDHSGSSRSADLLTLWVILALVAVPVLIAPKYHTRLNRAGGSRISITVLRRSTYLLLVSPGQKAPAEFCQMDLVGRKQDPTATIFRSP